MKVQQFDFLKEDKNRLIKIGQFLKKMMHF